MALTPPASPKFCGDAGQLPDSRIRLVLAGYIELTNVLGIGAYGTVYQARNVINGDQYAVKALNKAGLDSRQRDFQKREIELHFQASRHESVVSMHKVIDTPDCTFVVLEYCPEGDLFAKITEEGHYIGSDQKIRNVFLQILRAVAYCHEIGIYHRDLKPENVLVKDNGFTVKLADFGLATRESLTSDFGCGSTFYMSPECQDTNPHPLACYRSAPNDVWSLGVILVNLTCGRIPWKRASMDDSTFKAFRKNPRFLQSILDITDDCNAILARTFDPNPETRITVQELILVMENQPRLTKHSAPEPLTPEHSPLQQTAQAVYYNSEPVFEALPSPRYPVSHQAFRQPQQLQTPLPSPPASAVCTPQQSTYTPQVQSPASYYQAPVAGFQTFASPWNRCGAYLSQFTAPQGHQPYWTFAH